MTESEREAFLASKCGEVREYWSACSRSGIHFIKETYYYRKSFSEVFKEHPHAGLDFVDEWLVCPSCGIGGRRGGYETSVFDPDDKRRPRYFATFEEARAYLIEQTSTRLDYAIREVEREKAWLEALPKFAGPVVSRVEFEWGNPVPMKAEVENGK